MAALPKALARRGHRVMVVVPRYSNYEQGWETGVRARFRVSGSDTEVRASRLFRQWLIWPCTRLDQRLTACVAEGRDSCRQHRQSRTPCSREGQSHGSLLHSLIRTAEERLQAIAAV